MYISQEWNSPANKLCHPLGDHAGVCLLIPGFLSPAECQMLIAASEARGYASANSDYPPSYRNNDRQVLDSPELAQQLFARLQGRPSGLPVNLKLETAKINCRFRFCRYQPGQQFNLHQDGVHHRGAMQSDLTFMIYLSEPDSFNGGDTVFYSCGPGGDADDNPAAVIGRLRPAAGSLILFDHGLWQAGAMVDSGVKYVLRSDVLFQRPQTTSGIRATSIKAESIKTPFHPPHQGYVWTLADLGGGKLASGGRDSLIRLWNQEGEPLAQLTGHQQSVLGLAALPHGRLASVSRDRSLRFWDIASGACELSIGAGRSALLCISKLADNRIATADAEGQIKLWDSTGRLLEQVRHSPWLWSLQCRDELLASAAEDGSVKLWNSATLACLHTLVDHTPLRALAISSDAQRLYTGNSKGEISLWGKTATDWQMIYRLPAHRAAIRRLRLLSPDRLASAGEDNHVRIWQLPSFELLAQHRHQNFATDIMAMQGESYLSCAYDGQIHIHSLEQAKGDRQ